MFLLADLAVGLLVIVVAFLIFVVALKLLKQETKNTNSCEEDDADCCGDKNHCDPKSK